jgi:hypothetical protein
MENNTTTINNTVPTKKSSPVLTIILIVIALAGIGFGIFGTVGKMNSDAKIKSLEDDLAAVKKADKKEDEGGEQPTAPEKEDGKLDFRDYYLIDKFAMVKRLENEKEILDRYSYNNGYPQAADSFAIEFVAQGDRKPMVVYTHHTNKEYCGNNENEMCLEIGDNYYSIGFYNGVSEGLKAYFTNLDNYVAL